MNNARRRWVKMAYDKLDVNKDGHVTLEDISKLYDASYHPDVVQVKRSKEDVLKEFMSQWDT